MANTTISHHQNSTLNVNGDDLLSVDVPNVLSVREKAPALFLTHGAGPSFFVEGNSFPKQNKGSGLDLFLRGFAANFLKIRPTAIIIISAHWETKNELRIISSPAPKMYYDYGGFPPHTYEIQYPAKVDVPLANRVKSLLETNGFNTKMDSERGWDHGVFIPLKLMLPDADIPVVQISLDSSLDPALHYRLGALLEPLRSEGCFIVGSGASTHNGRAPGLHREDATENDRKWPKWLKETVSHPDPKVRQARLVDWASAPDARRNHAREEHFIPLHVVAGSAHSSQSGGSVVFSDPYGETSIDCILFD
jgi:aromatic ring-opening dioxygenase catalytic subunit (LigB family)